MRTTWNLWFAAVDIAQLGAPNWIFIYIFLILTASERQQVQRSAPRPRHILQSKEYILRVELF